MGQVCGWVGQVCVGVGQVGVGVFPNLTVTELKVSRQSQGIPQNHTAKHTKEIPWEGKTREDCLLGGEAAED